MKGEKGHTYRQWLISTLANLNVLNYHMQSVWISPYKKVLQSANSPTGVPLTDEEVSWIASSLCIAAAISVIAAAYLSDKFGRKMCLILLFTFSTLGWLVTLFSTCTAGLIIARIFCGLAAGACYTIVPIYIKEISQAGIRGSLSSLLPVFANLGILLIYLFGAYLDYYTTLWTVTWIPLVLGVLAIKAPESPAYLVKIGNCDGASSTIAYLRGLDSKDEAVQEEVRKLQNENEYNISSLADVSVLAVFKNKTWFRCFCIGMTLVTVQNYSGVYTILTYASPILVALNVTISADLLTLNIPVVMIVGSFICMYCIERFGRKPLFIASMSVILLAMVTMTTLFILQDNKNVSIPSWLPVIAMVAAAFGYSTGVSSIPYVLMAEIFNYQVRAKIIGYIVAYAWMLSALQIGVYTSMVSAFGSYSPFLLHSCINLFGIAVCLVLMPETKGRSVEEIEKEMNKK